MENTLLGLMSLFVSTSLEKKTTLPGQVSPFSTTPSEPLGEESNIVEGQVERRKMSVRKKQKKKKVSFSLGGLASDCHVNTTDQFDHVDSFLSASPTEAAVTLSRDQPVQTPQYIGNRMSMYEVIPYNSENDEDLCYYSGAFVLGGDLHKNFAKDHWMIDSGCTDHLTPFKDNFAHLGTTVCSATIANGQTMPMYGPGKIILESSKDQNQLFWKKCGMLRTQRTDFCL